MNRIDAIINELTEISKNPAKAVEDFTKKTGKGAVGVMPVYAPEELIHASGYLPVGIWGGQKSIKKARTYLPPFACSIMQSIMEMQIEGAYDDLKAVLISVPCDTLKCISQKWKGTSPTIVFTHPQNRKIKGANRFLVEEFKIIKSKLENILGVEITEEAIEKSIEVYNENRSAMREFVKTAADYPDVIDPVKRHNVIKSRYFMEKSEHTALIKELNQEINKLEKKEWTGKKVVLTGITAEPDELLEIFKEFDIAVAADDLAQESKQFRIDVPAGDDPLLRLAKWWQDFDGCSLATNVEKPRGQMLIDMVKENSADAVIVCMMKFCDPEEFDYPIYYQQLQDASINNIMIEIDQESTSFEQVRTRINSFSEMLQTQA
ncbi:Benzoyl-CoA reductase/2-hydroxyglutaryl-CoA dehydratase subunit, BcrC/BadD/HgdB [Dethiosulfatibacter aminovorans DSM 17477]|uniref:Benzoyl-CoA reductase/2-hydroxyglutaryl-CoA dehydratase subunit, BcrC/BadD/HgdB n=1 Tax=Dethiosulfatibacter aminovorans DSM 17477 TaxID=1121476 RepID=A0A1M6GEB8_9FIRM|nr:2-hydroxyacyl-CoA dehydratase family protein [Dethiosulfatibacter aminovorans]SHJ08296.1 Benzoyl-CoA reductase/2-hydroxyglutaryl-CoA dehydratase subunit, BcrC/BadD/HgdB [Dethiosulfatibacter aminovorans DSM 17477]